MKSAVVAVHRQLWKLAEVIILFVLFETCMYQKSSNIFQVFKLFGCPRKAFKVDFRSKLQGESIRYYTFTQFFGGQTTIFVRF